MYVDIMVVVQLAVTVISCTTAQNLCNIKISINFVWIALESEVELGWLAKCRPRPTRSMLI